MNKGFNEEKKYTLRIAPMIEIENCAIMSIPIATIPKLDDKLFIKGSSGEITLWPLPIAEKTACNTYELLPINSRWNHVLKNAGGSHITCMVLPDDIPVSILNAAKDLIYQIEANRNELSRKQIYTSLYHGQSLRDSILTGYNVDPDAKLMKELLGANSYSEKQARREKNGKSNEGNVGEKKQGKPACLTHEIRNAWNECACENHLPSMDEVLALIPTKWQSRMLEVLYEDQSSEKIQYIWKKIQHHINQGTSNE